MPIEAFGELDHSTIALFLDPLQNRSHIRADIAFLLTLGRDQRIEAVSKSGVLSERRSGINQSPSLETSARS